MEWLFQPAYAKVEREWQEARVSERVCGAATAQSVDWATRKWIGACARLLRVAQSRSRPTTGINPWKGGRILSSRVHLSSFTRRSVRLLPAFSTARSLKLRIPNSRMAVLLSLGVQGKRDYFASVLSFASLFPMHNFLSKGATNECLPRTDVCMCWCNSPKVRSLSRKRLPFKFMRSPPYFVSTGFGTCSRRKFRYKEKSFNVNV